LYADLEANDSAKDAFQKTREACQRLEDHFLLLNVELAESGLARREGKFPRASTYLRSAEALIQKSHSNLEKSLWAMEAGSLALAENKIQVALQHLTNAFSLFEESGQKLETASAALLLSRAYSLSKCNQEAWNMMEVALKIIQDLESNQPLIVVGRSVKEELKSFEGDVYLGASAVRLLSQIETFERHLGSLRRRLRPHAATVLLIPPRLSIFALGKSQVKLDGKTVTSSTWVNQKRARELFFFLLAHPNKSMTREEIGVIFWPESSTEQLRLQFRNSMYYLRYALGQDVIINAERRYSFNSDLDYSYDVQDFERSLVQADTTGTPARKIELLQESIQFYQGEYFPEGEGAWVMTERQRLTQMHEQCLLTLAQLQLEAGEPKMALMHSQAILTENHCMESAHQLAMQALAAMGDRSGVANQYELCKQYLLEELGLEPSPETVKLYKLVR
jgi:DNA-binding SARP family transcriptional activator